MDDNTRGAPTRVPLPAPPAGGDELSASIGQAMAGYLAEVQTVMETNQVRFMG